MQLQIITCVVFAFIATKAAVMYVPESALIKRQVLDGPESSSKGSNSKVEGYSDKISIEPDMGKKPPRLSQTAFEPEDIRVTFCQMKKAGIRSSKGGRCSQFISCIFSQDSGDEYSDDEASTVINPGNKPPASINPNVKRPNGKQSTDKTSSSKESTNGKPTSKQPNYERSNGDQPTDKTSSSKESAGITQTIKGQTLKGQVVNNQPIKIKW
ncbi:hypothetical protein BASA62_005962 [Batrachochytrium salamandrivorans]|nr:hypothetical protein BASA62_005962 [Batrachochytrium salamandrivorans]